MKKPTLLVLLAGTLGLLFSSCRNDVISELPDDPPSLKNVTFHVRQFQTSIEPMLKLQQKIGPAVQMQSTLGNVFPSDELQIIYFWSFNEESVTPDIGIHRDAVSVDFTTHAASGKVSYPAGRAFAPYPAGQSFTLSSPKEIIVRIPLVGVSELGELSFDATSSGTGPKSFELLYSFQEGNSFHILRGDNQFQNTKDNGWNRFTFDLSNLSIPVSTQELSIKLVLKSGERGEGNNYNENTGSFRLDNVGLTAVYNNDVETNPEEGAVYFHLFRSSDSTLVASGKQLFVGGKEEISPINVQLPEGVYFGIFFVSFSGDLLGFPAEITHARDLYYWQHFREPEALFFGSDLTRLDVRDDVQRELIFERSFSEVNFSVSEHIDLVNVEKIIITHPVPIYYQPYSNSLEGPPYGAVSDTLTFIPEWGTSDYPIRFHQFLGLPEEPVSVKYQLSVYDKEDQLLNEFIVEASIPNNIRLIFTGSLFSKDAGFEAGFPILWNEEWGETLQIPF